MASAIENSETLRDLFGRLREAATQSDVMPVLGLPDVLLGWIWDGELGDELDFVAIAAHANARLMYFHGQWFSLEDSVLASLVEERLVYQDDDEETPSALNKAMRKVQKWESFESQLANITAVFIVEGVSHHLYRETCWYAEFVEDLSTTVDEIKESWSIESDLEVRAAKQIEGENAELLARSERYGRARNEAQRAYVAEEMFPDLAPSDVRFLTELAALIHWDKVEPEREKAMALKADELYESGLSMVEAAAQLGVSKDRLTRLLAIADTLLDNQDS